MKSIAIPGLALLAGALALYGPSATARPASSTQLDKAVSLGEHWYGDKINLEELKGRVVLYEFWGIN